MKKGLFITMEGTDGSGKSTQIGLIRKFLDEKGYKAIITREPGGTPISEKLRQIVLDKNHPEMDYMTEALIYAAARAQHVAEIIKPALKRGETVICDRFIDSSIVYQGFGRKLGDSVRVINEYAIAGCFPDITFLLKVNPAVGTSRIKSEVQDRIELEQNEFHDEVFKGYVEIEKLYPERVIGIDASGSIADIHRQIASHLECILEQNINSGGRNDF